MEAGFLLPQVSNAFYVLFKTSGGLGWRSSRRLHHEGNVTSFQVNHSFGVVARPPAEGKHLLCSLHLKLRYTVRSLTLVGSA